MQQDHTNPTQHKKTLCRFYLRGLCIYKSKECPLSHGVWDLNYDYWKEDEPIDYQYQQAKDQPRKNKLPGPRIYKDLYEFQQDKVFSLEELNTMQPIRAEVRNLMHQQLYLDFMDLLEVKHPGVAFTEPFLLRQFTRVGFNKIKMDALKFSHILAYVCEAPGSKYFKTSNVVPPTPNKQTIIIRKAPEEEIIAAYRQQYQKIMKGVQKSIQENTVKKHLFTATLPENVPPLNLVLKDKQMNLGQFIEQTLKEDTSKIVFEASIQAIEQEALTYLKQKLPHSVVNWNDLYNHLSKALKTNNGRILNEVKPYLVFEGNYFLFFPMIQFIYNPKLNAHTFKELKSQPCKCPYQQPYKEEQLCIDLNHYKVLKQGESYNINNFQSLVACAPHILSSQILGVDLEGNLRKGGFVEMIQLNNGKNTFLIDIWDLNEKGDFQTFWLARKILRNVMVNPKIVKIFHDCRHDSIGLHEMIQTCIVNVFDTSASETLIGQLDLYQKLSSKEKHHKEKFTDCKNIIGQCNNVKTPGLNEILKKYEAPHGINKNKDKYHKMWSKGEISFFCMRPLDPDYRDYCIRDVLDLPQVYKRMLQNVPEQAKEIAYWVSTLYAQSAYQPA